MKPYYSLNDYLIQKFGQKTYKIALNGGMSCPNRDGLIDTRGCIFCSAKGSGEFAGSPSLSIRQQIEQGKALLSRKYTGHSYIAYFQAYTNTCGDISYLEKIFSEAISHPDIVCLSIATRPDCLPEEIIRLLQELNRQKPVWVELGLQTIHDATARYIRRGYELPVFEDAVSRLHSAGIETIVHMIIGLPHESRQDILTTAAYIASMPVQGIKLQLLHVLRGTDLARDYSLGLFETLSLEEYIRLLADILEILPPDMVIHRLTGDGDKRLLIAPTWSTDKKVVLNTLYNYFRKHNVVQGKFFIGE